jgi:hypothetical protein
LPESGHAATIAAALPMKKRMTSKSIRSIPMLRVYPAGWTLVSAHLTLTYRA